MSVKFDSAVAFTVGVDKGDDSDRLTVFVFLRAAKHLSELTLHIGRLPSQDVLSELLGPHVHIRDKEWLLSGAIRGRVNEYIDALLSIDPIRILVCKALPDV